MPAGTLPATGSSCPASPEPKQDCRTRRAAARSPCRPPAQPKAASAAAAAERASAKATVPAAGYKEKARAREKQAQDAVPPPPPTAGFRRPPAPAERDPAPAAPPPYPAYPCKAAPRKASHCRVSEIPAAMPDPTGRATLRPALMEGRVTP